VKKRLLVLLASIFILFSLTSPLTVQAGMLPYSSYTYDADQWPIWMTAPYIPVEIIGQSLMVENADNKYDVVKGLSTPEDICIDEDGFIYVADKDNNRIVKFDSEGILKKQFGITKEEKSILSSPEGVYVDSDGLIYVADTGNQRVVVFNQNNEVVNTIEKPDDVRIKDILFSPIKLTVDARGYIFVAIKGGNEGLLILSPDGKFHGFFGRNTTELSLSEKIKRIFYTKEQIATNNNSRAVTISSVVAGKDGYIYTCTQNMKKGQIKKFNANGEDLFDNKDFQVKIPSRITNGETKTSSIASIAVDNNDIIYAVDQNNGAVIIYGGQGQTLSIFGSKLSSSEQRVGVFGLINGIAVAPDGTLYVLDKQYNGIHVFRPTKLFTKILQAITMYNDGLYKEASSLWQEILNANSNYYLAHLGLGKAAYVSKDWPQAMEQMKIAMDQNSYSEAYWQYRSMWIQKNITTCLICILLIIVLYRLTVKLFKFSPIKWINQKTKLLCYKVSKPVYARIPVLKVRRDEVVYAFNTFKHPVDTFYNAVRRGKGSIWSAIIIFAIYVIVKFTSIACTSFSFNKYGLFGFDPVNAMIQYIAPILLWVLGVYLVGAITKGQGTLKAVFITSMYCLIPQIVLSLLIALISNVLTRAELSIYNFMTFTVMAWTFILMFVQVKEVHGYDFGETIKRVLAILFTIGIAVVLGAAIIGISIQAYNLANELIREVLGYV